MKYIIGGLFFLWGWQLLLAAREVQMQGRIRGIREPHKLTQRGSTPRPATKFGSASHTKPGRPATGAGAGNTPDHNEERGPILLNTEAPRSSYRATNALARWLAVSPQFRRMK